MGIPNNRTVETSAFIESSTSRTNVLLNMLMLIVVLAGLAGYVYGLSLENKSKDYPSPLLQSTPANPGDSFSPLFPKQD